MPSAPIRYQGTRLVDAWVPGFGVDTLTLGPVWTDGGLATTATELAKFGDALHRGRVVSAATFAAMSRFSPGGTGLGIFRDLRGGRQWMGHDGRCEAKARVPLLARAARRLGTPASLVAHRIVWGVQWCTVRVRLCVGTAGD
jgi:hypothetical protein